MLSDDELLRYSRQILLPQWDVLAQEKLRSATVLLVGLGGLGSPVALYLAAAGVGRLVLADFDSVDLSNLQRQIAHATSDIGRLKVESARDRIQALNPLVSVECVSKPLDEQTLPFWVRQSTLVVDGCDNFSTRFAVNQACVSAGVPLVSGAATSFEGQVSVYDVRRPESPCYRCLYPGGEDEAASCSESGVLSPLVGVVGSLMAVEAAKVLGGVGEPLVGRLCLYDAFTAQMRILRLSRDRQCPVCSGRSAE